MLRRPLMIDCWQSLLRRWGQAWQRGRRSLGLCLGLTLCCVVLLGGSVSPSWGQEAQTAGGGNPAPTTGTPTGTTAAPKVSRLPVNLNGAPLFYITSEFGVQSIPDRTATVTRNIEALAQAQAVAVDSLALEREGDVIYIRAGELPVMVVTQADAAATNTSLERLASQYLDTIRNGVLLYRQENSWGYLLGAIARFLLATLLLPLLRLLLIRLLAEFQRRFPEQQGPFMPTIRLFNLQILSAKQASDAISKLLNWLRRAVFTGGVIAYIIYVLGLFPVTRGLRQLMADQIVETLRGAGAAIAAYLPNFLGICLIITLCRYTLTILHPLFKQLDEGAIAIPGFYPEWAKPTYRLVEFFLIAIATVLAFPMLPGFGSDAFQGISLVIGVVVSLGSTGAMSNAIAGIILIYTRSFQVGDRVAFNDLMGDVEEKLLLVTRLRTFDNVIITIPNGALLGGNIVNYSASMRETHQPVSFTTQVTLGYDVPWREVYQVLGNAAIATPHVLQTPEPVILQVGLGDFSVAYDVKVFTNQPNQMERILSELHQNIQDRCNQAGIEILSPTYSAVRDGNTSTMPASYLPDTYTAPGFQLNPLGNLFQVDLHTQQPPARRRPRKTAPHSQAQTSRPAPPAQSPSFSVKKPTSPKSNGSRNQPKS